MTTSHTVTYEITPAAIHDAIRLHTASFVARFRVVMLTAVLVGVFVTFAINRTLGLFIVFSATLFLISTWVPFLDRTIIRNRGRGVMGEKSTYVLDDLGIHYQHPLGSGDMPWSAVTDVRINDKSITFGRDRVLAAYIPTSAFATPGDRDAFVAFARAHVGGPEGSTKEAG
jgi:hypothetical protein